MNDNQCFICKSWMDEDQLVKCGDGFFRCYEHAYLNQETLISALREAGEKMAQILKWELNESNLKDSETLDALVAWEAANK